MKRMRLMLMSVGEMSSAVAQPLRLHLVDEKTGALVENVIVNSFSISAGSVVSVRNRSGHITNMAPVVPRRLILEVEFIGEMTFEVVKNLPDEPSPLPPGEDVHPRVIRIRTESK